MYKLIALSDAVQRIADGAFIPNDENNADWREYQEWLTAGNVPTAAETLQPARKR